MSDLRAILRSTWLLAALGSVVVGIRDSCSSYAVSVRFCALPIACSRAGSWRVQNDQNASFGHGLLSASVLGRVDERSPCCLLPACRKSLLYWRKFRSQTSDNMERWKSRGGKSQRGRRKEDAGAPVREEVGKSRFTVFFQWFVAPEGRKATSLKRRVRSHLARWEIKSCTPL